MCARWKTEFMRKITIEQLAGILEGLPEHPRVVASGNFATPSVILDELDRVVPEYRLHMLNAQKGIPDREGVRYETAFVGPGMRGSERLDYIPCRLSLVPVTSCRPRSRQRGHTAA